jgi:WD40 repeat protein
MFAAIPHIDALVKEYLLFRGFVQTLGSFENERKTDRLRAFQVEKIVSSLWGFCDRSELKNLLELWAYLEERFVAPLSGEFSEASAKLALSLKRYYLVCAVRQKRSERVREFFEWQASEASDDANWESWYALPYAKNPEGHPQFKLYFGKTWFDSLSHSLHNFLSSVFNAAQLPRLLNLNAERVQRDALRVQIKSLQFELESVRHQQELSEQIHAAAAAAAASPSPRAPQKESTLKSAFRFFRKDSERKEDERRNEEVEILSAKEQLDDAPPLIVRSIAPVSASSDGPFAVTVLDRMQQHAASLIKSKLSPSAELAASCSADGVVKLWSIAGGREVELLDRAGKARTLSLAWSSDSQTLYCGGDDATLNVCSVKTLTSTRELELGSEYPCVQGIVCSPNSMQIVCAASHPTRRNDGALVQYSASTLQRMSRFALENTAPNAMAFNDEGSILLCGSADGFIRIFSCETQESVMGWRAHDGEVLGVAFDATQSALVSVGEDGRVTRWSLKALGQRLVDYEFDGAAAKYVEIAMNESRMHFALGTRNANVLIYNVDNARPVQRIGMGHTGPVVDTSWRGDCLLAASLDHSVRVAKITQT